MLTLMKTRGHVRKVEASCYPGRAAKKFRQPPPTQEEARCAACLNEVARRPTAGQVGLPASPAGLQPPPNAAASLSQLLTLARPSLPPRVAAAAGPPSQVARAARQGPCGLAIGAGWLASSHTFLLAPARCQLQSAVAAAMASQ